jgi:hypothetical protein
VRRDRLFGIAAAALAALVAPLSAVAQEAAQEATGQGGSPAPASRFLIELPDEVKTIAMGALAVAIAVYLWRNLRSGD